MFVTHKTEVITHEDAPGSSITIKRKLGYGDQMRLTDAMAEMGIDLKQQQDVKMLMNLHFGAYQLALAKTYIVGWEYTDPETQQRVPFSSDKIDDFDIDGDPLVRETLRRINARHHKKPINESPNPKSNASNGSMTPGTPSGVVSVENPSDATIPMSS